MKTSTTAVRARAGDVTGSLPLQTTPEVAEAMFPELFKIARQLRARGGEVRVHSLRVGDIDPVTGEGGTPVKVGASVAG